MWHSHSKLSFHLNGKLRCSPELALYCTFVPLSMVHEVIIHLSHITCNISPSPFVIVEAKLVTDITIILEDNEPATKTVPLIQIATANSLATEDLQNKTEQP
jgi:hypothetical protein